MLTYPFHLISVLSFAVLMVVAAVSDGLTYRISNRINVSVMLLFLFAALLISMPVTVILVHLSTGLSLLVLGFLLFKGQAIGGGDAKLMAGIGLWLGWKPMPAFLMWTALAGGVLGIVLLVIRQARRSRHDPISHDVPYGIALAIGALAALPFSYWWQPT